MVRLLKIISIWKLLIYVHFFQITQTDRYSKVICEPCCLKLQSACDFASSVRKNDRALRQRYPPLPEETDYCNETIWPKPIQLDKNINGTVYKNVMDVEIKQEALSEDEYGNNTMEESRDNDLGTLEIKIEPEEIIQPMQSVPPEEHEESQESGADFPYANLNGKLYCFTCSHRNVILTVVFIL